jgi:ribonuclease D
MDNYPRPLSAYAAADVAYLHVMWREWRHFMGQGKMDKTCLKRMNDVIKREGGKKTGRAAARRDF